MADDETRDSLTPDEIRWVRETKKLEDRLSWLGRWLRHAALAVVSAVLGWFAFTKEVGPWVARQFGGG